jgi:signal transduction histidine kinase/purine-cytosine permease-like protein
MPFDNQQISRVRCNYNKWVGNETLEDYALRFTALKARRLSVAGVGQTALGGTAFLALEAIAATITLNYGFANSMTAMLVVVVVGCIMGLPIALQAAKHGLDIDLLTRGGGFGYLGSTLTSLIYASFTFIFFAIEAAILASALRALFGIPLSIGYIVCAVAVIPVVTHGITAISRFQLGTLPVWLMLQCLALVVVAWYELDRIGDWTEYLPAQLAGRAGFDLALFGAAASVLFALVPQIGEQVDYLRFLPPETRKNRVAWWFWLLLAGPGWLLIGFVKMCLGSFLAWLALQRGMSPEVAADPVYMYQAVFNYLGDSPQIALALAGIMVIVSQMKINVTNAYAGSIAWSNFFSRLTHNHPGRIVWLVFNVIIALILMELGIYRALESILSLFSIGALSWLASLSADLMINKPLGLSPSFVEFKRGHLYDINPVGVGSMLIAGGTGLLAWSGVFGATAASLAHFISIALCYVCVPLLALATRGRYYLARQSPEIAAATAARAGSDLVASSRVELNCSVCETPFEAPDMLYCPAYAAPICSLCCALDSRCLDACKPGATTGAQLQHWLARLLPQLAERMRGAWLPQYLFFLGLSTACIAALLALVHVQLAPDDAAASVLLRQSLVSVFFIFFIINSVIVWLFLLTRDSRLTAQRETRQQTERLLDEIRAHEATDKALQEAKEQAEQANQAKSRYLTGISHELRTPLQSMLGYAQLLLRRKDLPPNDLNVLQIIHRSGEYLSDLIEGLLDISKIEAGRLDIYRNEVDLPELIRQLDQMFRDQAEVKGLNFLCVVDGRLPELVLTDEKRLRQILINLLSNAVKYTARGSVELHIRYRNQVAEFRVSDTGVGIDTEDLERILLPFERVRNALVPSVSGTGLGLTIVKLLVDILGGDLRIRSTAGKGSEFTVSLLLPWKPAGVRPTAQRPVSGYDGGRRSVMVVDDEPLHRGLLSDLLLPLGFSVVEATSGSDCLQKLGNAAPPDLFVLDINMPVMNGLELAAALREQGHAQPIMVMSADARERHGGACDSARVDAWFIKPVKHQDFLSEVGRLLGLDWQFEAGSELAPASAAASDNGIVQLGVPDVAECRELLAYAKIGYRSGVQKQLDAIEAKNLLDPDAIRLLRRLSDHMHFERMVQLLAARLEPHSTEKMKTSP